MPPSTTRPSIAFFGATGGVAASILAQTLRAGYPAIALARTPSKLTALLTTTHSIPESTLSTHLTIIAGSITDPSAVQSTLHPPSGPVTQIVYGVGGSPVLQASVWEPVTLDQPSICFDGVSSIISSLRGMDLGGGEKPRLVCISTTGIAGRRDVPWALYGLYHYLLAVPHRDKRRMEDVVFAEADGGVFGGVVAVRPTLLTDGVALGRERVRVGWEWPEVGARGTEIAPGPAVGYSVSRADVGEWVFREVVIREEGAWVGRCVSLSS